MYEKAELEKYGFEVILTRTNKDKDLALVERGKSSKGCKVFISNHTNACSSESVDHASVIYPVPFAFTDISENKRLATMIANNVQKVLGLKENSKIYNRLESYDRNKNGIKTDDEYYGVLHGAQLVDTPYRLIVEHGFHTNTATAKKLLDDNIVKYLAMSEAKVIADFFGCAKKDEPIAEPKEVYHTVVKGDSLSKIAKAYGIALATVKALNPDVKAPLYIIRIGQKIRVK